MLGLQSDSFHPALLVSTLLSLSLPVQESKSLWLNWPVVPHLFSCLGPVSHLLFWVSPTETKGWTISASVRYRQAPWLKPDWPWHVQVSMFLEVVLKVSSFSVLMVKQFLFTPEIWISEKWFLTSSAVETLNLCSFCFAFMNQTCSIFCEPQWKWKKFIFPPFAMVGNVPFEQLFSRPLRTPLYLRLGARRCQQ